MFKFFSFNWLSFVFVISVLLKMFSTNIVFSFVFACCFVITLIEAKKCNIAQTIKIFNNNKLLFIAFIISFLTTFYHAYFACTIKNTYVFEILLYGITTLWGIFLYKEKGIEYIENGLFQIFVFLSIISVTGIYEYITNDNIFVKMTNAQTTFLMNKSRRIGACFMHPIPYANVLLLATLTYSFLLNRKKKTVYLWLSPCTIKHFIHPIS